MNGDEPAFPIPKSDLTGSYEAAPGMSLRAYFAAMAMQGLLASLAGEESHRRLDKAKEGHGHIDAFETLAMAAVMHADNLIAELNKTRETK